ncbi:MAG: bifunctional adenosylcobinamide kinase/adenosylcobinamide-phosphate guanylyltransferase [Lachnospiraceae bacterium]|nr:bifunctional adenosylcobinamide kinase/adenosylcobinamide-phosphate guanylyltransferase [Lachnospiraceae bacterium]
MISIVIGKSNTGKSELAERLALKTGDDRIYYLATMNVCDDAGRERVVKHRKQREGKGFITIERQKCIAGILDESGDASGSTVLLECVANLVSNYIFDDGFDIDKIDPDTECESIASEVSDEIRALSGKVHNLIIVTNEYDKDGEGYDDATRFYVKTLSRTNELIIPFCDMVYDLLADDKGN